jgi:stearoyl-CoA desaturase (delta-9 desaturase)
MTPFRRRRAGCWAVAILLTFFVAHWVLSVFMQTFFLHRYAAHRMFSMSPRAEKVFHFLTWLFQGSSYLNRFLGGYPSWPALERIGDAWVVRVAFGAAYVVPYLIWAPHWAFFLLLPAHFFMGPLHGAIVNWAGHMYGYRNFATDDRSRNTIPFDFVTLGELFQNNHHRYPQALDFGARAWEIDPASWVIRLFSLLRIIRVEKVQTIPRPGAAREPSTQPSPVSALADPDASA